MSRAGRLALICTGLLVLVVGGSLISKTVADGRDPNTIHALGTLPERISVCGRTWTRDRLLRQRTLENAHAWQGVRPIVVATGPFAPCPAGPCTTSASPSSCQTVVWVRVGEDVYVDYALSGGP